MLLLLFEVGGNRFGIEASEIVEVIPLVSLRKAPCTPASVAGVFNYRGQVVPVLDVSVLLGESPARRLLSTRIILARQPDDGGGERVLGLLAERVTETLGCRREDFQPPGIRAEEAQYLGEILPHAGGLLQKVKVSEILSDELKTMLFEQPAADSRASAD